MNCHIKKNLQISLSELLETENSSWLSEALNDFPKKYERHGDLIVFSSSAFSSALWKDLDEAKLWRCISRALKVKRIARQGSIRANDIRSPSVEMLLGTDTWVTHVDNKVKYSFDVTKCMFSSGNVTEKLRMAKMNCQNEVVVDMFTGIGYFSLPLLIHAKAKHVHACEWNPDAVIALRKNLRLNKVESRCTIYAGDNRKVCPVGIADRVVLGLIPTAKESYLAACAALNPYRGGVLHIHSNVSSQPNSSHDNDRFACMSSGSDIEFSNISCNRRLKPDWTLWAIETAKEIQQILTAGLFVDQLKHQDSKDVTWHVTLSHIERVKSYAPHIDHLVLDLLCCPSADK